MVFTVAMIFSSDNFNPNHNLYLNLAKTHELRDRWVTMVFLWASIGWHSCVDLNLPSIAGLSNQSHKSTILIVEITYNTDMKIKIIFWMEAVVHPLLLQARGWRLAYAPPTYPRPLSWLPVCLSHVSQVLTHGYQTVAFLRKCERLSVAMWHGKLPFPSLHPRD